MSFIGVWTIIYHVALPFGGFRDANFLLDFKAVSPLDWLNRSRKGGHVPHVEESSVWSYRCIVSVTNATFLPDRCDSFAHRNRSHRHAHLVYPCLTAAYRYPHRKQ